MLASVTSCAVIGLEGITVEVEVDISSGLPSFTYVLTHCYRLEKPVG
jgi:magnesium chelatase family protein